MTEPKLPDEPTPTDGTDGGKPGYIACCRFVAAMMPSLGYVPYGERITELCDYADALRSQLTSALALAAEREVEIARLIQHNESWALLVKQSHQLASDAMKDKEAANARAEAAEANDRRYRWLRDQHWTMETLIVTAPKENMIGFDCPSLERLDAAIDAMAKS